MNKTERGNSVVTWAVLASSVGLYGCYTILSHPQLAPEQRITENGAVLGSNDCASCHTQNDLWGYHHRGWYSRQHAYFYNQYDPLFYRSRWYGDSYFYGRWVSYRYSPWWYYPGTRTGAWHPEIPAVGRGTARDSVSRVDPRSDFVGLPGYGPGPMPTFSGSSLPLSTGMGNVPATSRVTRDSTVVDRGAASGSRPVRVEPRADVPASLPVTQQSVQPPAATKAADTPQEPTEKTDDENQSRGRGDARTRASGSGSR